MHILEPHVASLRSQALVVLATNQARAADQSLSLVDRQVATLYAEEAQAVLGILDNLKPNLGAEEARKITARIRALLEWE
ncbi:hypothetical protein ACVIU7_003314 [Bradyrhizobium liaoningense]